MLANMHDQHRNCFAFGRRPLSILLLKGLIEQLLNSILGLISLTLRLRLCFSFLVRSVYNGTSVSQCLEKLHWYRYLYAWPCENLKDVSTSLMPGSKFKQKCFLAFSATS